jgi:hypothetical protein
MDKLPDRYIVEDRATKRLIVCELLAVADGVPVLRMIPGRVYERLEDAIRGAHYKPQGSTTEKTE